MSYQSDFGKKPKKFLEFTHLNINPCLYNYIQILFLHSTASKSPSGCSFQRKKRGGLANRDEYVAAIQKIWSKWMKTF